MHAVGSRLRRLARAWTRFLRERGGNTAITFALAALPILGAIGAAIDYGRAVDVKVKLQAAIDSTALMLSKEAATDTSTELQTNASNYFFAMFDPPGVKNVTVTAEYSGSNATSLIVKASASVPTTIAQIFGVDEIDLNVSSTAKWGETRLRVALVLDNTGSMASAGKIDALKTATANLLNQLKTAATVPDDVYVSIVPFVKDVSVDASGYNSSWDNWIYWGTPAQDPTLSDNNSWDAQNGTCNISGKSSRSSCTSAGSCSNPGYGSESSCTSSTGYCSKKWYTSKFKCQYHGGTWTTAAGVWTAGVWTPKSHSTWNGCLTDRGTPSGPVANSPGYDQDVTTPTSSIPATLFPAEQYSACPKSIVGLNYNWTAMNAMVSSMTASGNTNQPIGLVWGWQTLVGGGPFTAPAFDSSYKYKQVIILLSDGMNTQDRWSSSQSFIDNRMYDSLNGNGTCANIKAAGIEIYTIQVNTGHDPTSTLLQNCASNTTGTTDHFYLLTSASQIITVFNQIGTALSQLRIAK